jgi:hypothetical protein
VRSAAVPAPRGFLAGEDRRCSGGSMTKTTARQGKQEGGEGIAGVCSLAVQSTANNGQKQRIGEAATGSFSGDGMTTRRCCGRVAWRHGDCGGVFLFQW